MKRSTKKLLAILCVAFFILSVAVPAFATSKNTISKVPQVQDGHPFYESTAPILMIKEENESIASGASFRFELRLKNAKWLKDGSETFKINDTGTTTKRAIDVVTENSINVTFSAVKFYGDDTLSFEATKTATNSAVVIKVPLITKVDGEGDVEVIVDGRDSPISSGSYVYAVSAGGKTITSISKVKKFAGRTTTLEPIRIDETRIGSLGEATNIKLKLPPKYTWSNATGSSVKALGLTLVTPSAITVDGIGKRTLEFKNVNLVGDRSARGSLFLEGLKITADRDAAFEDVVVDVDGTNVTAEELVVAKRMDYDAEVTIKEVKELLAGREAEKTEEIKIKENVKGSLIENREINVVLPKWVKIKGISAASNVTVGSGGNADIDGNELYITVLEGKGEYKFKLELSIEADQAGDIVAEFSGAGMEKQELLIAKAIAPITAEVASTDLKIGVQNQSAPDIIITEAKKGAIDDGELTITLPKGIKFASTPEVEVKEGNLEIEKPKRGADDEKLTIKVKSTSTKPSTIEITNIELTLDRTVPEGEFKASIGGDAIVKNLKGDNANENKWKFDKGNVIKFVFANVITPAPGETRATTTFTIGDTNYTVVEAGEAVEYTMDVAPYIKDGRTFLPVRYVAYALGVSEDNILWDQASKKVTVFKGEFRTAQVAIGSKAMMVNGVSVDMDVAPEITDGRTMLPIRWMAKALGADIDWDPETREVTVTQ